MSGTLRTIRSDWASKATIAEWRALAAAGDLRPLVQALIEHHYDPAYGRFDQKASQLIGQIRAGETDRILALVSGSAG